MNKRLQKMIYFAKSCDGKLVHFDSSPKLESTFEVSLLELFDELGGFVTEIAKQKTVDVICLSSTDLDHALFLRREHNCNDAVKKYFESLASLVESLSDGGIAFDVGNESPEAVAFEYNKEYILLTDENLWVFDSLVDLASFCV